ncbi:MAG: ATP-sensitive inward rectifier potassium channel 10 [Rhizomicrobium sp.]
MAAPDIHDKGHAHADHVPAPADGHTARHAGGHARPVAPHHRRRSRPIVKGQDLTRWTDFYHGVLTAPWWAFFLGLAAFFVGLNAIFALFYVADPHGISNARAGSYWDALFFSIQTIGSVSSTMQAQSAYVRIVASVETFAGIVELALVTGVIFARFSRPFARIVFSNVAVIVPFEGVPTLMLRAANQRGNLVLDASASVTLARQVTTAEGTTMRRFEELKLVRARSPLFALSWTMMHPIDRTSPLYGATHDTFYDQQMEIIVLLSGMDETLSQTIYARHAYSPEDIVFGRRFVDVLHRHASGRMEVDLHRFHDTEPWKSKNAP